MKKALLSFCLVITLVFSGCNAFEQDGSEIITGETSDFTDIDTIKTDEYIAEKETIEEEFDTGQDMPEANGITYFAFDLFGSLAEGENLLVSPISALTAIAMVGNGASGETLSEIESTICYEIRNANKLLRAYLPTDSGKLSFSNSLWCNESVGFVPYETYRDTLRQSYSADIYSLPFDESAVPLINGWVNEKTDGMIDHVIEKIPNDTALYAINTLLFDAEWNSKYSEDDISDGEFFSENGEVTTTEFLTSTESFYLVSDTASGFIKYYEGKRFSFIGLLPNEGIGIEEYRESLTAFAFNEMIENTVMRGVSVTMPKFAVEYENELSDELLTLGINKAFDPETADFSMLGTCGDNSIYIRQVIHKTKIEVGELGTKAGAVTAIDAPTSSEIITTITLNRPFVYIIYDFENEAPIFIGTLTNP